MKQTKTLDQFEQTAAGLIVRAPAKINLSLLITGKRPDGFHVIETVMAKINWYDELIFEPTEKEGINLICTGTHWALGNEVLKWTEYKMEKSANPLRFRVAGIVTKYNGEYYILLQRAARAYNHGNFVR